MKTDSAKKPLWTCPKCGQTFVSKNLWHSCVRLTLNEFFKDKKKQRKLYNDFLKFVRTFGPVKVNINKSRISFQGRVRFAGVPRLTKDGIICGFWLKRKIESPRFTKVELIPPHDWIYQFKLTDPKELDKEVASWIREAYRVGQQNLV